MYCDLMMCRVNTARRARERIREKDCCKKEKEILLDPPGKKGVKWGGGD